MMLVIATSYDMTLYSGATKRSQQRERILQEKDVLSDLGGASSVAIGLRESGGAIFRWGATPARFFIPAVNLVWVGLCWPLGFSVAP